MRVHLLGTGSADRLPNPWCACPRCTGARRNGEHRARTSVLVDDCLLIDPGPDIGSGGVPLTGVRTVLITHDHPDHLDPAFLLAWSWAGGPPLLVGGPPDAVERCQHWVGPDAAVSFLPLAAGDEFSAGDLHVRAFPAAHSVLAGRVHDGTALLYEVTGDARLLHASDTAALPHEQLGGPYDLVLLECTFGERTDHGSAHLDLPSFAAEVTALRAAGRLASGAQVVAVHLSHHTPSDLGERLAEHGARVVDDGTVLELGVDAATRGRRLLVTGGARSGKSARAETVLAGRPDVRYVAAAPAHPDDPEWVARIAAHRARRPSHWDVVELPELTSSAFPRTGRRSIRINPPTVHVDHRPDDQAPSSSERPLDPLAALIAAAPVGQALLVDCLTLWLTGVVDAADAWEDPAAAELVASEGADDLCAALATTRADVVLVSNEVGSGLVPTTASGRLFRDLLGRLNAQVAAVCDDVELVTSGLPLLLKGRPWTRTT